MILKEILTQINILEILNNSSQKFLTLNYPKENPFEDLKDLIPQMNNFLAQDINDNLKLYENNDLLYNDFEYNVNLLTTIIKNQYFSWITLYKYQLELITNDLGVVQKSTGYNSEGYAGFDLENQDGDFRKYNRNIKLSTTSALSINDFLRNYQENLFDDILYKIKNEMLVIIW